MMEWSLPAMTITTMTVETMTVTMTMMETMTMTMTMMETMAMTMTMTIIPVTRRCTHIRMLIIPVSSRSSRPRRDRRGPVIGGQTTNAVATGLRIARRRKLERTPAAVLARNARQDTN